MRHAFDPERAQTRRRQHRRRRLGLLAAVVLVFSLSAAYTGLKLHQPASVRQASTPASWEAAPGDGTAEPQLPPPPHRLVYAYSVVAGGVADAAEVAAAMRVDPVVADHYRGFNLNRATVLSLGQARLAYVSYRVGNRVAWTRKQVKLHPGEKLVTDGKMTIRGRCGNRVSDAPVASPALLEEPEILTEQPKLPDSGYDLFGQPLRRLVPKVTPGEVELHGSHLLDQLTLVPPEVLYPGGVQSTRPGAGFYAPFFVPVGGLVSGGTSGGTVVPPPPATEPGSGGGGSTPGGGTTPGGSASPGSGPGSTTNPGGNPTPGDTTTPGGGGTTPGGGGETPGGGGTTPGGGGTTPGGGGETPGGGGTTPGGGGETPGGGGETPGGGGETPGGGGETPGGGGEEPAPIPEPSQFVLLGGGLALLWFARARRSVKVSRDGENCSAAARK